MGFEDFIDKILNYGERSACEDIAKETTFKHVKDINDVEEAISQSLHATCELGNAQWDMEYYRGKLEELEIQRYDEELPDELYSWYYNLYNTSFNKARGRFNYYNTRLKKIIELGNKLLDEIEL